MRINIEIRKKKAYFSPQIERIGLDNEISLALESNPASGPGEPGYGTYTPDILNNDPFKVNLG